MSTVTAVPIAPVKRTYVVYLFVGLALALLGAAALALQGGDFLTQNGRKNGVVTTASGLQYKIERAGNGLSPTDADVALVMYEGKLLNGMTFDKSQQPTPMPVATVVPGFREALKLMKRGTRLRAWLKPDLAYGDTAAGSIPAGSTLVFDVELIDFLSEAKVRQLQQQMMQQGAGPNGLPAMPGGR